MTRRHHVGFRVFCQTCAPSRNTRMSQGPECHAYILRFDVEQQHVSRFMYTSLHVVLSHVTLQSRFTQNARICNRGKKGRASAAACGAQALVSYRVDGGRRSAKGCVGRRWLLNFFPSRGAAAAASSDSAVVFVEEITWAVIQRKDCYGLYMNSVCKPFESLGRASSQGPCITA